MSEEQTNPSELDTLKERANTLGLSYHPSIGPEKLREKVNAALSQENKTDPDETQDDSGEAVAATESTNELRVRKKREASEQVRIIATCMNPNKKDYEGEIFMAGNTVIGTFKKYVPFGVEWHVPRVIYNMIKQRQCQVFQNKRDSRGRNVKEGKLIPEFTVSVLDPLKESELKELAQRQAMANGTANAA